LNLRIFPGPALTQEAFGTAKLNHTIKPDGIVTSEVFGLPKMTLRMLAVAIASGELFGTPNLAWRQMLLPPSIASLEVFGMALVYFSGETYPVILCVEPRERIVDVIAKSRVLFAEGHERVEDVDKRR
jgi:hypothetical protein